MNKKLLFVAVVGSLLVGISRNTHAEPTNNPSAKCLGKDVAFLYFNGIHNDPAAATASLLELKRIHGTQTSAGDVIRYELMYNHTNGFSDVVETFEQRLLEQNGLLAGRFELFFEVINGDGPWWNKIAASIPSAAKTLNSIADWYQAAAILALTKAFGNPPTALDYAQHRSVIDQKIDEGRKLLLVAHSQGNLFANVAYDYARKRLGTSSVKVVHIAPASSRLVGSYTLANLDLVINGLRVAGTVADNTDDIPDYAHRPAGVNGKKDILGHNLIAIYLNPGLTTSSRVKTHIQEALASLVSPQNMEALNFFSAAYYRSIACEADPATCRGITFTDNSSSINPASLPHWRNCMDTYRSEISNSPWDYMKAFCETQVYSDKDGWLPVSVYFDGKKDFYYGSDEASGWVMCDPQMSCGDVSISIFPTMCNGVPDCPNGADEDPVRCRLLTKYGAFQ